MFKEWLDEPNRLEWQHNGLTCLIVRHDSLGHLCGYVAIPESHPLFGVDYTGVDVDVHGGLTFSDYGYDEKYRNENYYRSIYDSNGQRLWWVGFDCGHSGDVVPYNILRFEREWETYKNIDYVKRHTESLAEQLATQSQRSDGYYDIYGARR